MAAVQILRYRVSNRPLPVTRPPSDRLNANAGHLASLRAVATVKDLSLKENDWI